MCVIRLCYYTHKVLLFVCVYVRALFALPMYNRTRFHAMQLRYLSRTCTHPVRPLACYRSRFALSSLIACTLFRAALILTFQWSSRLGACTTFRDLRYLHGLRGYARTLPCSRSMRAGVLVSARAFAPLHPLQIIAFLRLVLASLRESYAGTQPLLRVWVRFRLARLLLHVFRKIAAHTRPTTLCAAARLL